MCMIAGYAGPKRAAPILIEMMRRQQYIDGGRSTGIATIHEGKLYTAKFNGNLDRFLEETNGADLPGNVGIMHSRTGDNLLSHAHPFTSEDGKLALVTNGTKRDVDPEAFFKLSNEIMADFYNRGFTIKTAWDAPKKEGPCGRLPNGQGYLGAEPYALIAGDYVASHPEIPTAQAVLEGIHKGLSLLPRDVITVVVHEDLPDTISLGNITRPMHWAHTKDETYLATCPIAMPDEVQKCGVLPLPCCSIAQATSKGLFISSMTPDNVRSEQIDMRVATLYYTRMEAMLKGKKDDPLDLYDFPYYTDWRDIWNEPLVDCKYPKEGGLLKPTEAAVFLTFWNLYKEGRLHSVIGERNGYPSMRFWLDD